MRAQLDLFRQVHSRRKAVIDFVEWLEARGIHLCEDAHDGHCFVRTPHVIDDLVLEHFGIDKVKLEEERRGLLDVHRERHGAS